MLLVVASCSDDESGATDGQSRTPETTTEASGVDPPPLTVIVSSQASARQEVPMEISVDGRVIVEETFISGSGHNYQDFPLDLPPGEHEIVAKADDGTISTLRR